jgi:hypothetical protein
VSGNVTIRAAISDVDGLAVVEWLVDGDTVFAASISGQSSGVSFQWNAAYVTPGRHTIAIVVTDTLGNRATGTLDLVRE